MDDYPYQQPSLLTLQDMLNLSSDDENNDSSDLWASSNPYSISNFFEPIISSQSSEEVTSTPTTTTSTSTTTSHEAVPSSSSGLSSSSSYQHHYVNPFDTPPKRKHHHHHRSQKTPPASAPVYWEQQQPEDVQEEVEEQLDFLQDIIMFDESQVKDELIQSQGQSQTSSQEEIDKTTVTITGTTAEPELILPDFNYSPEKKATRSCNQEQDNLQQQQNAMEVDLSEISSSSSLESDDDNESESESSSISDPDNFIGPNINIRLEEVRVEKDKAPASDKEEREKKRKLAVFHLTSLISTLKQYSSNLGTFLATEGDIILEHYSAQTMLGGILPEISQVDHPSQPYELIHFLTKSLIDLDLSKGQRVLSRLPPRTAHLWRTSELILLQQAVLESVITRKLFLLNCRYTDLLSEMGFDSSDLQRLQSNPTLETELGTMKIIMHEHDFFSKSLFCQKQPIRTVLLKQNPSGQHRALVLPSPYQLVEDKWRASANITRRTGISTLKDEDIDWLFVMKKMWMKNPHLKVTEQTCRRTYEHLISSKYNKGPWSIEELRKLQQIREKFNHISWSKVAERLETNRTPFACFLKYKDYICDQEDQGQSSKLEFSNQRLRFIRGTYEECFGNVTKLDYLLSRSVKGYRSNIKPRSFLALFRHTLNPRLKKERFSVVEDVLLFATMERFRKYLVENDGILEPVAYALPWRSRTNWRMRFARLLTTFYYKGWTLDEDKLLWNLVSEYGPNYKIIQRSFPHKDRKQCRTRYVRLSEVLKSTKTLESFHSMIRCNGKGEGLHLKRLNSIADYLYLTIKSKIGGNFRYVRETDLEFLKFRRAPRESELEAYLLTYPTSVLISTFNRLVECLLHILEVSKSISCSSEESEETYARVLKGFNRRLFDPNCPASVASALHLRFAKLLPREILPDLSPFEENVYNYFEYFSLRGRAKVKKVRNNIPTLESLRKLSQISRLIEQQQPSRTGKDREKEPPGVILEVQSQTAEDKAREEAEVLKEIEDKRLGGRRKGSVRKRTQMRENRKKAAMLRWGNKKLVSVSGGGDDENSLSNSNVASPWSSSIWESDFGGTGPSSVASTSYSAALDLCEGGDPLSSPMMSDSIVRKAAEGMLSDHSYILPTQSPTELSGVPLEQLFSILGNQRPSPRPVLRLRGENLQQQRGLRKVEEGDSKEEDDMNVKVIDGERNNELEVLQITNSIELV